MKRLLFLTIMSFTSFVFPFKFADYQIVFVHIGSNLPVYIIDSIEQARLFNPKASLALIANRRAVSKDKTIYKVIKQSQVNIVYCEDLNPSKEHLTFLKTSTHNTRFREAFWLRTTERFFYIHELYIFYIF